MTGTSDGVIIEPMRLDDLDTVAAIESVVSAPAWTRQMFESELTQNQFAMFFVARGGTRSGQNSGSAPSPLCGYVGCWIVFEELHLLNVVTHPDWRRRGIATRLVQAAFDQAASRGAVRALLEVRESNQSAREFYARLGFRSIARRPGYYTQPSEDAVMMSLELAPAPTMR